MGDNEKKPSTVKQGTAKPPNRRRISVWAVPNDVVVRGTHTIGARYQGLGGVLDDVSLQATFCNKADLSDLRWDPNFMPGAKDAEIDTWLADVQKGLAKDKIQVLAGYALMAQTAADQPQPPVRAPSDSDEDFAAKQTKYQRNLALYNTKKANFDALDNWLNAAIDGNESPKMDVFVASLVAFFNKHCPDYDGISFDIEGLTPTGSHTVDAMGKAVSRFFGAVAAAIDPKIVAVATGALVSPTNAFNNYKGGSKSGSQTAIVSAQTMPYEMAVGHANLIVRPMMYDGQPAHDGGQHEAMLQWQRDMCVYALVTCNGGKGIASGSFQVGLKTSAKGGTGLGAVTTKGDIKDHATECRTHKSRTSSGATAPDIADDVGIIFFPSIGPTTYADVDAALNPGAAPAGSSGTPLQVPRK